MNKVISYFLKAIIILYQKVLSPLFAPRCRYTPTCSQYALESVTKYGAWKGGKLMIKRFLRCHPFGGNGYDPVP